MLQERNLKERLKKEWNSTVTGRFNVQTSSVFDSIEISSFLNKYPLFRPFEESIRTFYRHREFSFAWFDQKGLIEHAGNLAHRVMNLETEGLDRELPYSQYLDSMVYNGNSDRFSEKQKIGVELMLTAQYFAFANLVWEGMEDSVSKAVNWYLPRKSVSYEAYLDSILNKSSEELKSDEIPVYRQYRLLKEYLLKYRQLESRDDWYNISGDKTFKRGDTSYIISEVRQRLYDMGDIGRNIKNHIFDRDLENAVKQFQSRHGLSSDGVLGSSTFRELNVPLKSRIRAVLVNMERSRWVPVSLINDYLVVNIPEFKLHVYNSDSLLWSCNVVVGQSVHKTVVFKGDLKYVVFRPYWNVPPSIVRNEILPAIRKDGSYLNRHRMEITGYSNGLPQIRQKPGPQNSLGLVKFVFPNSYNIYLHDTPVKSLFTESSRAFSHGCIRISEPRKLAEFLLREDPVWDTTLISKAMHSGTEQYVTLKKKVPVFIAYFTAFVDRKGLINFRKDIYERDERLSEMMMNDLITPIAFRN